jgi:hypothetical protein
MDLFNCDRAKRGESLAASVISLIGRSQNKLDSGDDSGFFVPLPGKNPTLLAFRRMS